MVVVVFRVPHSGTGRIWRRRHRKKKCNASSSLCGVCLSNTSAFRCLLRNVLLLISCVTVTGAFAIAAAGSGTSAFQLSKYGRRICVATRYAYPRSSFLSAGMASTLLHYTPLLSLHVVVRSTKHASKSDKCTCHKPHSSADLERMNGRTNLAQLARRQGLLLLARHPPAKFLDYSTHSSWVSHLVLLLTCSSHRSQLVPPSKT